MSKNEPTKRRGPRLVVKADCMDCKYEQSEHYAVQGDSGCRVFCTYPDVMGESAIGSRKRIGDTTWDTPKWCPLLADAFAALRTEP